MHLPQKDCEKMIWIKWARWNRPQNFGNLMLGNDTVVPCTPLGCWYMLKKELNDLTGYHALVIGRSNIVGKPMQSLLIKQA